MANRTPAVARACALFEEGYSCSQAVCAAFAAEAGLPEAAALRMSSPFGGGMARQGLVCGAVSGGLMVLGVARGSASPDPEVKAHTYAVAHEVTDEFRARYGSLLCRELLGCDLSTPEGREEAAALGVHRTKCPRFVETAAELVEKSLWRGKEEGSRA